MSWRGSSAQTSAAGMAPTSPTRASAPAIPTGWVPTAPLVSHEVFCSLSPNRRALCPPVSPHAWAPTPYAQLGTQGLWSLNLGLLTLVSSIMKSVILEKRKKPLHRCSYLIGPSLQRDEGPGGMLPFALQISFCVLPKGTRKPQRTIPSQAS